MKSVDIQDTFNETFDEGFEPFHFGFSIYEDQVTFYNTFDEELDHFIC